MNIISGVCLGHKVCPDCHHKVVKQGIIAFPVRGKKAAFAICQRYQCKNCEKFWYVHLGFSLSELGETLSNQAEVKISS